MSTIYKVHPAAELFPMLDEPELQALADDIKANGLLQPIVLCGNEIIDGRNRLAACKLVDVEPDYREADLPRGDRKVGGIVSYIISANLSRRHLSTAQRAAIAAELATMKVGANQHQKEGGSNDPPSTAKAAKMLNVSTASVKRAKTTMKTDPAAHEAAKAGKPKPKEPKVPEITEVTVDIKNGTYTAVEGAKAAEPKRPSSFVTDDGGYAELVKAWKAATKNARAKFIAFRLGDAECPHCGKRR